MNYLHVDDDHVFLYMLTEVLVILESLSETYIVGVEACCIENSCLKQTSFKALIDSGTSFTYLPEEAYENIVMEVHSFCSSAFT